MAWRRRVRYFKERLPGYGVILNSVDRGKDAPLTSTEDRSLTLVVLALVAVPALIAAAGFGIAALLR